MLQQLNNHANPEAVYNSTGNWNFNTMSPFKRLIMYATVPDKNLIYWVLFALCLI